MPKLMITTVVPVCVAPLFSEVAAQGLKYERINAVEAGCLMAIANAIASADEVTPKNWQVTFPDYWLPHGTLLLLQPTVVISVDQEVRKTAKRGAGVLTNYLYSTARNGRNASLVRDWCLASQRSDGVDLIG